MAELPREGGFQTCRDAAFGDTVGVLVVVRELSSSKGKQQVGDRERRLGTMKGSREQQ